jgi:lipoprotein-releasing system permease protein
VKALVANLPFSLFLSLRYLRPKRTFVSVITVISVIGVTIGVAVLTIVIAVMTGFNIQMRERILGSQAHLTAQMPRSGPIANWPALAKQFASVEGVRDVCPFVEGQAVLDFNNVVLIVRVVGIDPHPGAIQTKHAALVPPSEAMHEFGAFDLSSDNAVIGRLLSEGLGIPAGEKIILHSVANGREILDAQNEGRQPEQMILPSELKVTGVIQNEDEDPNAPLIYVPLEVAQSLFQNLGTVNGIDLELTLPYDVEKLKTALAARFPELEWTSWIDRNAAEFNAVSQERTNMYFLLFLITLVAAFCITNTMITVTTQKRHEIGLMRAVGANKNQIAAAFLWQGFYAGLIGTGTGLLLAFFFLAFRRYVIQAIGWAFGLDPYDPGVAFLWDMPAKITALDLSIISAGAFLSCALAALLPATIAAELDPATALRNQTVA